MRDATLTAGLLSLLLATTSASQKPFGPDQCCKVLEAAGVEPIIYPHSANYSERVESFWSLTSQLKPNCFVLPGNTEEVSTIVKTLVQKTKCEFAVRSGGHSSNAGYNNIDEGITIDLSRLNTTDYNADTKIASVRPGARWLGVYQTMDALDRGIQGGGIGSVGVGGLLLGGGFANYAYQRGLATDDIVNFEVVLGNGTVVEANASANADLWRTLKGGGSGFGIVTRYDMYTFDRVPFFSTYREYAANPELDDRHIVALKRWTDNPEAYPSGSTYVWWTYRPADNKTILISQVADIDGRPDPPASQELLGISGYQLQDAGVTNMSTSSEATQAYGYRNIWFTLTFKNDERIIRKSVELHHRLVDGMLRDSIDRDFETQAYFQPFPSIIARHSEEKGGNILGFDRLNNTNSMILLGSLAVNGKDQEALGRTKMRAWRRALERYSAEIGVDVEYRYMNYADGEQDVLGSYGAESLRLMMDVSRKYDPEGVFQTRVPGGYKLPWDWDEA